MGEVYGPLNLYLLGLCIGRTQALAFILSGIIPDISEGTNLINIHSIGSRKDILNWSDVGVNIWEGVYLMTSLGVW